MWSMIRSPSVPLRWTKRLAGLGRTGGWVPNQSKTLDSKRFIWFWEKVRLFEENSTMIVEDSTVGRWCLYHLIITFKMRLVTIARTLWRPQRLGWEFSWTKKTVTHRRLSAFGSQHCPWTQCRNSHIEASGLFSNSILSTRDKNLT